MSRLYRVLLVVLILLGSGAVATAATSMDEWTEKRDAQALEDWRKTIPDLDRRLYERVKKLNSRVITLTTLVAVGIGLQLIMGGALIYLVRAGRRPPPTAAPAEPSGPDVADVQAADDDVPPAPGPGKKAAVFTLALLTPLMVAEASVRLLAGEPVPTNAASIYDLDPCWGYAPKPGLVNEALWLLSPDRGNRWHLSTTGQGFRANGPADLDRPVDPAPGPRPYRIAVLGGSTSFGWGVDDAQTWPAQLEALLNEGGVFDRPVQVLNFAASGRGGTAVLRGYACSVAAYRPDLVVWMMVPTPQPTLTAHEVEALRTPPPFDWRAQTPYFLNDAGGLQIYWSDHPFWRALQRHSQLYRWIATKMAAALGAGEQAAVSGEPVGKSPITVLQEMLSEHGGALIVGFRGEGWEDPAGQLKANADAAWAKLEPELARNGNTVVNVRPILSELDNFLADGHWSAQGHRLVAAAVARQIFLQQAKPKEPQ